MIKDVFLKLPNWKKNKITAQLFLILQIQTKIYIPTWKKDSLFLNETGSLICDDLL